MSSRAKILAVCSAVVVALLAVALFAPLPITIAYPGMTANVLGANNGQSVITVTGTKTRPTSGQLRMVTIAATAPNADVHFSDVWKAWWSRSEAAMPRSAVYPGGGSVQQVTQQNLNEMKQSQQAATAAALKHMGLSPSQVKVDLKLADVGGPSAGLMFTLGIIDRVQGDGKGNDLTGGRTIAGTGTIDQSGAVGAVGGVPLKEQAAKRDGATVFLTPKDECSDAKAELPAGLKLIPVNTLDDALSSLAALRSGAPLPSC
ncbi:S16 family serine protease [Streptomyces sp. RPT161]|uniref:S16 family serine protease n=1 Tax=Streptomyces sp. RPT161 TaxID=3015993 RepID=UPI0022B88E16|nr:S16 family serine protease [Streptomyces sp. RPT161]